MKPNAQRRQRGQITMFMVLVAVPITLGIAYLFNSAELLSRKVRAQNAADAAALAQATWMARSMNVIAANNVALTQTEAINTIAAAVNVTVTEIYVYLGEQVIELAVLTAACVAGNVAACGRALIKAPLIYATARALENLAALSLHSFTEFQEHTEEYANFNARIADRFPDFSARMQESLAISNGLRSAPRMQAVGWREEPGLFARELNRTGLPVSRVDARGIAEEGVQHPYSLVWAGMRTVYETGADATLPLPTLRARNFATHGYEEGEGKGPYPLGRDTASDQLSNAVTAAKALGWSAKVGEENPEYDDCWTSASTPPWVPLSCKEGFAAGPTLLPLYAPATAPEIDDVLALGVTDVLVLAQSERRSGFIAGYRFANSLPATYALAKARLYNATSTDLYSSDWRATLVPVTSWKRGNHELRPELSEALDNLLRPDEELYAYTRRLSDEDWMHVLGE